MFDPVTAAFVRGAPRLPGLEPDALGDELTRAYMEIAAARLTVGQMADTVVAEMAQLVDRMSRLADTFEAQIILGLNPDRRRPAAFVAGSARQVIGHVLRLQDRERTTTRLDEHAVGAEIAAALLFLIAERSADAFEAARDIQATGEPNPIRRALILTLGRLARGRFTEIASLDVEAENLGADDDQGLAADLLFNPSYGFELG